MPAASLPPHALPWAAIVAHTPLWVWGLLALLVVLGLQQCTPRQVPALRVLVLPLALAALAAQGLAAGGAGVGGAAVLVWLAAAAASGLAVLARWPQPPAGARYDAATRRLHLPGSAAPLALMLGLFLLKYAVGVALALRPALAHDGAFALQVAALYGPCNGVLAARAARLWRLVRAAGRPAPV